VVKHKLTPAGVIIPEWTFDYAKLTTVVVKRLPTRQALGARKARSGCPGGANSTQSIAAKGYRDNLRRYASKGH
jgi:hypothetical protein